MSDHRISIDISKGEGKTISQTMKTDGGWIKMYSPELLTHPNIPKPLHGLNPRTLLGKAWWDEKREVAYAQHNYHCWACGIGKAEAKYHQWLEGHEHYDIDYVVGRMELKEIVALCYSCHNFIHSGRLWKLYSSGKVSKEKITEILLHGFGILEENNLKPFIGAIVAWSHLKGYSLEKRVELAKRAMPLPRTGAKWQEWHLVVEGQEYYSMFKSFSAWRKHFGN